jgi:hypothetical protein
VDESQIAKNTNKADRINYSNFYRERKWSLGQKNNFSKHRKGGENGTGNGKNVGCNTRV